MYLQDIQALVACHFRILMPRPIRAALHAWGKPIQCSELLNQGSKRQNRPEQLLELLLGGFWSEMTTLETFLQLHTGAG